MATTVDADAPARAHARRGRGEGRGRDARATRSSSFRTDVEGLRALGVLLVVAFHATVPHLAGGFVGVDVFFVISGFLITGLLVREGATRGRISLQDFYARRIRRILPAACVVLAATVPLMLLTFDPLRTYRSLMDLGAALLYVSNWRFIHQNNDYLAVNNDHSPALHYWSLSVEEQFYLVWPLLIVGCVALCRRYRWRVTRVAVVVLGVVTVASYVANLRLTVSDPGLAYLATQTRAWQFGTGGLLALVVYAGPSWLSARPTTALRWVLGWAGLAAVGTAAYLYTNDTAYPGVHALAPTLGTAAIIFAGSTAGGAARSAYSVSSLFSLAPLRWIGRMSYAWYLWHWPLIVCAEARWPDLGLLARSGVMLVALVLAWLTHVLVERPLIVSGLLRRSRSASVAVGVTATVVCGCVLVPSALAARHSLGDKGTAASGLTYHQVFGPTTRTSGAVTPAVLTATSDQPADSECLLKNGVRKQAASCVFGPAGGAPVVLFGDSSAQQWQSAFRTLADRHGWRLSVITHAGCPPFLLGQRKGGSSVAQACIAWRSDQLKRIATIRPKLVFVGSLNRYNTDRAQTVAGWRATLDRLRATGAKVVYLVDTPYPRGDVPSCVSAHLDDWSACDVRRRPDGFDYPKLERSVLRSFPKLARLDVNDVLCEGKVCPAVRNGVLVYRDFVHLTDTAAQLLVVPLERQLVRQKLVRATS